MKNVKMLVSMAGPDESWKPGDCRDVDDTVAEEWHRLGIAIIMPDDEIIVNAEVQEPSSKTVQHDDSAPSKKTGRRKRKA